LSSHPILIPVILPSFARSNVELKIPERISNGREGFAEIKEKMFDKYNILACEIKIKISRKIVEIYSLLLVSD